MNHESSKAYFEWDPKWPKSKNDRRNKIVEKPAESNFDEEINHCHNDIFLLVVNEITNFCKVHPRPKINFSTILKTVEISLYFDISNLLWRYNNKLLLHH